VPWFFLWIQQLLKLGTRSYGVFYPPVLCDSGIGLLPYVLPMQRRVNWVMVHRRQPRLRGVDVNDHFYDFLLTSGELFHVNFLT